MRALLVDMMEAHKGHPCNVDQKKRERKKSRKAVKEHLWKSEDSLICCF